jgi:RNA polymerase sigma-70 factor (ECF subfamily)
MFSITFTRNTEVAEEIVQDMFVRFWEDRHKSGNILSLKSYFLKTIQNRSIDWLRHLKIRDKYAQDILEHAVLYENDTERYVLRSELEMNIEKALKNMPVDVAETFRLNRFEGLTYPEIAQKLNISVRTVEVRIGKALHLLRRELQDYLISFIALWYLYQSFMSCIIADYCPDHLN